VFNVKRWNKSSKGAEKNLLASSPQTSAGAEQEGSDKRTNAYVKSMYKIDIYILTKEK